MSSHDHDARGRRAYPEPSLDELLGDPIMHLILRRDGIDETAVRALIKRTAESLYGNKAAA